MTDSAVPLDLNSPVPKDINNTDDLSGKRKQDQRSPQIMSTEREPKASKPDNEGNNIDIETEFDPHQPNAYAAAGLSDSQVKMADILEARLAKLINGSVEAGVKKALDENCIQMENAIESRVTSKFSRSIQRAEHNSTIAVAHVAKVSKQVDYVKKVCTKQLDRIIDLELKANKNNMIFFGVPEDKSERSNDKTLLKIKEIINAIPNDQDRLTDHNYHYDFDKIVIERCYRMGRYNREAKFPRNIFVRVINFNDKSAVMDGYNRRYLPEGVFIRNDYPPEIRSANRSLGPVLQAVQGTVYGVTRIKLIQGVIVIDGVKRITLQNILDIPKEIDYMAQFFIETQILYAWFGILHLFSNFHWCPFEIKGKIYYMTEQFIVIELAKFAKDEDAVTELENMRDPFEMKRRAKEIKGYSQADWAARIPEVAYVANKAKFTQNPYFQERLVETHPKLLAEASTEMPWGCGLTLKHEHIENPKKWKRQGIMGETLTLIRQEFIDARPPQPSIIVPPFSFAQLSTESPEEAMEGHSSSDEEEDSSISSAENDGNTPVESDQATNVVHGQD